MNEHLNKVKEERRDARAIQWLEILVQDLQFAVRTLRKTPTVNVVALVLRQGMTLTGMGLGLGLLFARGVTRLLASFLFGVGSSDPTTLAATVGGLASVAAVACYVPARTATRIEPLAALRAE